MPLYLPSLTSNGSVLTTALLFPGRLVVWLYSGGDLGSTLKIFCLR